MTLEEIAVSYDADKSIGKQDGTGHGYTPHYDRFFTPVRQNHVKLLEIGVGAGPSIRMWLDYFPSGDIHGVDITHDTNPYNTPNGLINRYTFVTGDQSCTTFWACFLADYGRDWDIIVDDGAHTDKCITTTFQCLWPHIVPGGLYCIEDLACAYSSIFLSGFTNPMDVLKGKIDELMQNSGDVEEMHFSKELCILRKKR